MSWPVIEPTGKPTSKLLINDLDMVKAHVHRRQKVSVGTVIFDEVSYRAAAEPVRVPVAWQLNKPSDWIDACKDQTIRSEFELMSARVSRTDPMFHPLLIKRRSLWAGKPEAEVVQACELACVLTPGCASGKPLR